MEYGCIGEHLSHSFSAEIHGKLGFYAYRLCEIAPHDLGAFLTRREFSGINVTIPYKQAVIPYLDGVDPQAVQIGAVNTVVNRGGKLYGYNTDAVGMTALMRREKMEPRGRKVLILGSGGTSHTAASVAKNLGAAEVLRVSRTGRDGCIPYEEAYARHADAEILINTTPVGMYPDAEECPVELDRFPRLCGVVDAVYRPLRTKLVLDARERDIPAVGGLYMLVSQAVAAAELFTGKTVPDSLTERIYAELFHEKQNVVLIGMPGCGKTAVGTALATALSREWVDTDACVTEAEGKTVPEMFSEVGEAGFRRAESFAVAEVSNRCSAVISTGGGTVLDPENVLRLKRNGVLVWLDRPVEELEVSQDRPLSRDRTALAELWEKRKDAYAAACDVRLHAESVEETVCLIRKECGV